MSDPEPTTTNKIFYMIGLAILIVAVLAVTFYFMFPAENVVLENTTMTDKSGINGTFAGLNVPFPTIDNGCLTDFDSYLEIYHPETGSGWITYGNYTELMDLMETYCGTSNDDFMLLRSTQT
jgi:hypothetical protein